MEKILGGGEDYRKIFTVIRNSANPGQFHTVSAKPIKPQRAKMTKEQPSCWEYGQAGHNHLVAEFEVVANVVVKTHAFRRFSKCIES